MATASTSMTGKVTLVTGATSGIGAVTAQALAGRDATVVLVGRDRERSAATVEQIKRETGNQAIDYLLADLSSQAEIRRLADEFLSRYDRLDVLVNNAGAMFWSRQETVDGLERTFALNHLSYFLLTNLLLDRLKASGPARIVSVSSDAHQGAQMNFDDLQGKRSYSGMRAYGQSKLANVLFTYELARRLNGTVVTANALHPGFVGTNFAANNGGIIRLVMSILHRFALSPEQGAQTSIYLATSPEVEGVTGKYFERSKPAPSSKLSYDETVARRLWDVSGALIGWTS
jgi:NAD(P)-dependent dehydrogenase (short-subunit alcohol dehydrogenase family)